MAILNPGHLLDQANRLIVPPPAGPPRQVDVRRAISASYYAVFHAVLAAAADAYVGVVKRQTREYSLVYRSIDHNRLIQVCRELSRPAYSEKYAPYAPLGGFGLDMQAFALAAIELQKRRHEADYNPAVRFRTSDAILAISTARSALGRFSEAGEDERKAFLSLLLFQPR